MFYKFPEIRDIFDVRPAIKDRGEFIEADKSAEGYIVVNYKMSTPDTFNMDLTATDGSAELAAIRRECRGIIFDATTFKLISRPFHKFFNVNERTETSLKHIKFNEPHVVMEKMDGSMVRPLLLDGGIRLATKMGCTDTSNNAEAWIVAQADWQAKDAWLRACIDAGLTPLFEWISPLNRIVIDYGREDLVLLAVRDNLTGTYHDIMNHDALASLTGIKDVPFSLCPVFDSVKPGDIDAYVAKVVADTGREGDVIAFHNGHRLKFKCEEYVLQHKAKESAGTRRRLIQLILDEKIDDTLGLLDELTRADVEQYAASFQKAVQAKIEALMQYVAEACDRLKYPDRKAVAVWYMKQDFDGHDNDRSFVFKMYEKVVAGADPAGAEVRDALAAMVRQFVGNHLANGRRWEKCADWLGVEAEGSDLSDADDAEREDL